MNKKILVCPPNYFDVVYKINPWMDPSKRVASTDAIKEWQELSDIYKDLEMSVDTIAPQDGLPDMVFTANGFFSINKKAIVARFRYKERQGETNHFIQWLTENKYTVIDPGKIVYEGEGDTFVIGKNIFQGWGFRSDKEILSLFEETYPEYSVIPLHLVDDRFYHLDTCFFPINEDLAYFYEKAFDAISVKVIKKSFKHAVAVTDEEALTFSLNSVTTDHTVVMNANSNKFSERVKSEGYRVFQLPMNEFFKSGGSVKCLTNEIWED